jgi:hypothetical protein
MALFVMIAMVSPAPAAEASLPVAPEEAVQAVALGRERLVAGDIEALELQERARKPDPLALSVSLARLAMRYVANRADRDAEEFYRRALALREAKLGPNHVGIARLLDDIARVEAGMGQSPAPTEVAHIGEARKLLKRALAIREKALGRDSPGVAVGLLNFTFDFTWRTMGAPDARPLFLRALGIRRQAFGAESAPVLDCLLRLARYDQQVGVHDPFESDARRNHMRLAAQSLEQALKVQEALFGADSIELFDNLVSLSRLQLSEKADDEPKGLASLERALAIAEALFGAVDASRAEFIGVPEGMPELSRRVLALRERALDITKCGVKLQGRPRPDFASLVAQYDNQGQLDAVETLGFGLLDRQASENERGLSNQFQLLTPSFSMAGSYERIRRYDVSAVLRPRP